MTAQRRAPRVRVYVDGRLSSTVHALDAQWGAGAGHLPRAMVEVQPEGRKSGRREFLNARFTEFNQAEVEIVIADEVVHWGKALAQPVIMDGNGDRVTLTSRMEDHHFGGPMNATRFFKPGAGPLGFELPCVFNPDIDGRTIGNMSAKTGAFGERLFLHEESSRTSESQEFHQSAPIQWTLPQAVFYLCCSLNPTQTHVANPTLAELVAVLPALDHKLIRNHECRYGDYLPEQLDRLLNPLGFAWTVNFLARGNRKIRVYQRGVGQPRELRMQSPGSVLNVNSTNLESCAVTADVSSRAFNSVHVIGDYEEYEATFELIRGWPKAYDDYPKSNPQKLYKHADAWRETPVLADVWRKWVLNEDGSYIGTRPSVKKPFDLRDLFGTLYIERRRRFEPCCTLNEDLTPFGHVGGVYLEWWDTNVASGSASSSGVWRPADDLSQESKVFRVLDKECGIRFDGNDIPFQIYVQGANAKVRVTASIQGDRRVKIQRDAPKSLLAERKIEVVDIPSRFKYRTRHSSSRFVGLPFIVDFQDDRQNMTQLADTLLGNWNQASINGTVTLTGIDYDYSSIIGAVISGISGRNVDFNVSPSVPKYPSVAHCRINFNNQSMELALDTPTVTQASIADDYRSQNALGRDRRA